jgi:hypothetical protein
MGLLKLFRKQEIADDIRAETCRQALHFSGSAQAAASCIKLDASVLKRACGFHLPGGNVKREVAAEIVDSLKEAGVDFVASLTEANLHDLVIALGEDSAIHHVPVTREEEGIGICAGAYLGGKHREPASEKSHPYRLRQ